MIKNYRIAPAYVSVSFHRNKTLLGTTTKSIGAKCTDVYLVIHQYINSTVGELFEYVDVYFQVENRPVSPELVVYMLPCPIWFELVPIDTHKSTCDCDSYIRTQIPTAVCNINTTSVTTSPQYGWIGSSQDNNCTVIGGVCPIDYCVSLKRVNVIVNDTNTQCALIDLEFYVVSVLMAFRLCLVPINVATVLIVVWQCCWFLLRLG